MRARADRLSLPWREYANTSPTIRGGAEALLTQSPEHLTQRAPFTGCPAGRTSFHRLTAVTTPDGTLWQYEVAVPGESSGWVVLDAGAAHDSAAQKACHPPGLPWGRARMMSAARAMTWARVVPGWSVARKWLPTAVQNASRARASTSSGSSQKVLIASRAS